MQIESWPIDKPVPYARNARNIGSNAIDKVAASLKEFGFRQPIVVDDEGVILVGHTRLAAAKQLGLAEVPVHVAKGLNKAQAKAYRLMDNRSHEEATWDNDLLKVEFEEIAELDFDAALTGFDALEIERLMGEVVEKFDANDEWQGMPEYENEDKTAFRTIHVHFKNQEDVDVFADAIGQELSDKTDGIWFPKIGIQKLGGLRYVSDNGGEVCGDDLGE